RPAWQRRRNPAAVGLPEHNLDHLPAMLRRNDRAHPFACTALDEVEEPPHIGRRGYVIVVVYDRAIVEELARKPSALHSGVPPDCIDTRDAEVADEEVRGGVIAELNHWNDEFADGKALAVLGLIHEIGAADEFAAVKPYSCG